MQAILGPRGEAIMAAAILISTFGCVNGLVLAGARIYYAMARTASSSASVADHEPLPRAGGRPGRPRALGGPAGAAGDGRSSTPARRVKYGNLYNELLEFIIPVDVTFYALMVGAVIVLRRKAPDAERPYRTIGYPLPILVYIGLAVLLVLDFIYLKPWTSGIGYLIVLAGIPVYLVWSRVAALADEGHARR